MSTTKPLKNYLKNEIRMRYAVDSILPYDDNIVLHRLFDGAMTTKEAASYNIMNDNIIKMSESLLTSQDASFSLNPKAFDEPLFHAVMNKYDLRPTAEDFQKIRDKNIKLCVVGYGGKPESSITSLYLIKMILIFQIYLDLVNLLPSTIWLPW